MRKLIGLLLIMVLLASGCIGGGTQTEGKNKRHVVTPNFTATLLVGSTKYKYTLRVLNSSGKITYSLLLVKESTLDVKCPANGSCLTGNWKGIEIKVVADKVVSTFLIPPHLPSKLTDEIAKEYFGIPAYQVPQWVKYHNPYVLVSSLLSNLSIIKNGVYQLNPKAGEVLLREGFGIWGKGFSDEAKGGTIKVTFSQNTYVDSVSIVVVGQRRYIFNLTTKAEEAHEKYVVVNGTKVYLQKLHFYMYGMKTCPHCRHMHEWIPRLYGNSSLTYYELVGNEYNSELYDQLHQLIGVTGVPVIAITYNKTLWAVVEGEFNATATPQIVVTAMKNKGVLLFVGGRWYILYYSKPQSREYINYLYTIFVRHKKANLNNEKK